mmetsp:Transcript_2385/g.6003  ORF Transcript_2385/g.6003 Transcript_2385/m.6003 type:complete len:138 (-) Transcript_2385:54-467(-)
MEVDQGMPMAESAPPEASPSHQEGKMSTTTHTIRGTHFEVDSRYTLQKYLGSGSYGVVVSATTPDETPVAIKKIGNVFKNSTTAKRTVREVLLMMHLRHDNVIGIADLTAAEAVDGTGATDLYVVTEVRWVPHARAC